MFVNKNMEGDCEVMALTDVFFSQRNLLFKTVFILYSNLINACIEKHERAKFWLIMPSFYFYTLDDLDTFIGML